MVRALSGHDFRRRHEGIVNKTTENEMQCRNCEEDQETASHVIMDCPVFTTLRAQAFGSYSADVSQVFTQGGSLLKSILAVDIASDTLLSFFGPE